VIQQQQLSWQQRLANSLTDLNALLDFVGLKASELPSASEHSRFPLRVTREYAQKIERGNPQDPLLLQVLPSMNEYSQPLGFVADPLQEKQINPIPGILKRYHGRVLLTLAGTCPINCRFCFRREFAYSDNQLKSGALEQALAYIQKDTSIEEVIYSGGEPLILSDTKLTRLTESLAAIPHVCRLRVHTRVPVVLPQRITDTLISSLCHSRLQVTLVMHCNHANELDDEARLALKRLLPHATLLNQAVLLANINDNLQAQLDLSYGLHDARVIPYYLHLLDPVMGSAHFDVAEQQATRLRQQMLIRLPGYLVPRLVRTCSGWQHKQHL
jgi:EF-P beta-lysylation protein EpmB